MHNHLINFIDANTILYKYQFGFRKSHSTNHAIISLVEKVNSAMDSGKISIGIFLDLIKAFDTVDHCILLDKLYKYGIRGTPCNWFKSYLENRKQYVCYSDTLSATMPITHGVPHISKCMGIILKARKVLKKKVLLQLYHSFVTPYVIYCLEIWGNASDIHLQPLITTQ